MENPKEIFALAFCCLTEKSVLVFSVPSCPKIRGGGGGVDVYYAGQVHRKGPEVVKCKLQDSQINCASLSSEISVL